VVVATAANIRTERWEFAVAKDRLYASRSDEEDRASAAGKTIVSSRSLKYMPRAGARDAIEGGLRFCNQMESRRGIESQLDVSRQCGNRTLEVVGSIPISSSKARCV
jgi:hypothetical protein